MDEIFHPGGLAHQLAEHRAERREDELSHDGRRSRRQDGVLRDHGGYDRTDFRINLDHRPRDDVQLSISGYHSRSNREELDPTNGPAAATCSSISRRRRRT